jgi:hypothetical protein
MGTTYEQLTTNTEARIAMGDASRRLEEVLVMYRSTSPERREVYEHLTGLRTTIKRLNQLHKELIKNL